MLLVAGIDLALDFIRRPVTHYDQWSRYFFVHSKTHQKYIILYPIGPEMEFQQRKIDLFWVSNSTLTC
jgi:hypothetical protein